MKRLLPRAQLAKKMVSDSISTAGQKQVEDEYTKLRAALGDIEYEDAKALGKRLTSAEAAELARST